MVEAVPVGQVHDETSGVGVVDIDGSLDGLGVGAEGVAVRETHALVADIAVGVDLDAGIVVVL